LKGKRDDMNIRNRLAALFAAGALVMTVGAVALAAPPSYSISVDKTATAAPPSGGTVTFTVAVDNTGSGHLAQVNVSDTMAGCTLSAPSGDLDTDGNLDENETWTYTCSVSDVTPGMSNTATVNACHSAGTCNNSSHDATGTDTVTVEEGAEVTSPPATEPPATEPPATEPPATEPPATEPPATEPPATEPPATEPPATEVPPSFAPSQDQGGESDAPSANPTQDQGGESDAPNATQASTDTIGGGSSTRSGDTTWMLILALSMLLASVLLASPSKAVRKR
jgi:uncharacterized repeat protein (TIGR01451 family)